MNRYLISMVVFVSSSPPASRKAGLAMILPEYDGCRGLQFLPFLIY